MSWDLVLWKAASVADPAAVGELLAEEEADCVEPSAQVLAFRAALLERWPELADHIEPWHTDLDWRQPAGRTDLADRYIYLTLPYSWAESGAEIRELRRLAAQHALVCYDPQSDSVMG